MWHCPSLSLDIKARRGDLNGRSTDRKSWPELGVLYAMLDYE